MRRPCSSLDRATTPRPPRRPLPAGPCSTARPARLVLFIGTLVGIAVVGLPADPRRAQADNLTLAPAGRAPATSSYPQSPRTARKLTCRCRFRQPVRRVRSARELRATQPWRRCPGQPPSRGRPMSLWSAPAATPPPRRATSSARQAITPTDGEVVPCPGPGPSRSRSCWSLPPCWRSASARPASAAPPPGKGGNTPGKAVFFAADGMRQDIVEKYAAAGVMPTMAGFLKGGTKASGNGLLTQAPPNTGAGWYTLATGAWPGVHGSTNNTFHKNGDAFGTARTAAFDPGVLQAEIDRPVRRARPASRSPRSSGPAAATPPIQGPTDRLPELLLRPRRRDQLHRPGR